GSNGRNVDLDSNSGSALEDDNLDFEKPIGDSTRVGVGPYDDDDVVEEEDLKLLLILRKKQKLHKRRPRGTGFLKFSNIDAATTVVSTACAALGLGIFLKGRQPKVLKALDKKSTLEKALEKSTNEDHDHCNIYLAKEGLILDGTPAAEGVLANDMAK
ncbi:hypothetical protein Ancab_027398, partial [Ancistrocladus abbreviatus]